MGKLERKLNTDLIERIEANGPQGSVPLPPQARRLLAATSWIGVPDAGRKSATYRGARRNARREREKNIRDLREKQSSVARNNEDEASVNSEG